MNANEFEKHNFEIDYGNYTDVEYDLKVSYDKVSNIFDDKIIEKQERVLSDRLSDEQKRFLYDKRKAYDRYRRHYRQLSIIPDDVKMYMILLTYTSHPTHDEFLQNIRQFMKKLKRKNIVGCPFFEYQLNNNFLPHWHILVSGYVNSYKLKKIWNEIIIKNSKIKSTRTGKLRKAYVNIRKIDKKYILKEDRNNPDVNPISAAINYCLKITNRDGDYVKILRPDVPECYRYKFKNTYIKRFIAHYKPQPVQITFYHKDTSNKKHDDKIALTIIYTRDDVQFDLNPNHSANNFFRNMYYDIIAHQEEIIYKAIEMSGRFNNIKNAKNFIKCDKFFLKKGKYYIKRTLKAKAEYELLNEVLKEAKLKSSTNIEIIFKGNEEISIDYR